MFLRERKSIGVSSHPKTPVSDKRTSKNGGHRLEWGKERENSSKERTRAVEAAREGGKGHAFQIGPSPITISFTRE